MRIYRLTPLGEKLARSTSNPDTAPWKVVHYLDMVKTATADQIADHTGSGGGQLIALRNRGVIEELSYGGGQA